MQAIQELALSISGSLLDKYHNNMLTSSFLHSKVKNFGVGRNLKFKCKCQVQSLIFGGIWSMLWLFMWKDGTLTPHGKSLYCRWNDKIWAKLGEFGIKTWMEKKKV